MRVGFVGLGTMGLPMATNVAKKYSLKGYDVVPVDAPFPLASSIEELVKESDVIVSMVPKNEHVKAVYAELLPHIRKGQFFIEMSTALAIEVEARGAEMCDCPVVKSKPAAIAGTLGIYVGGKKETFEAIKPILSCMGSNIIYMGGHGQGLVMKILHNSLVGQIQNGVNEVLGVAKKLNLNLEDVVTAISYGGGQNFYLDGKAQNIIRGEYPTAFSVENMAKDAGLALDLLEEHGLDYPGFKNTNRVYQKAMAEGKGKQDFSATFEVVNED